jgi:hypothetical protein
MVSEHANHLITNWFFLFDLTDKLFQTYLRLASRRSWRIGERDAMHRVSSLRHIYRSNSLYGFNLSNGIFFFSRVSPVVRPIQPWLCLWNCLFVSLFVCLILHSTLVFVCSGETHPGAKVWTWGAYIVKGASPFSHTHPSFCSARFSQLHLAAAAIHTTCSATRVRTKWGVEGWSFFSIGNYHTMSSINLYRVLGLNHGFEYLVGPIALQHGPHLIL